MRIRLSSLVAFFLVLLEGVAPAAEFIAPLPGSPEALSDWRWLARPLLGESVVLADLSAQRALEPAAEGGFVLLQVEGPGVLDHLISLDGAAIFNLEVDGKLLWQGTLDEAKAAAEQGQGLFPKPLVFGAGPLRHLLAPLGFTNRLRVLADKSPCSHHLSYRRLPAGTAVMSASQEGEYREKLQVAGERWQEGVWAFHAPAPGEGLSRDFVLQAKSRVTALEIEGSGELTHLALHFNPALTGSLREVVVEAYYDGRPEPALRMPVTDFVGQPHPWTTGRWGFTLHAMAGGLRLPWYIPTPRVLYPEATFHSNLPMPFARGLRLDLVNRSPDVRFAGFTRATVEPLSPAQALATGRLCGTRALAPVSAGESPQPLLQVPGPGQLVGLGMYLTGNDSFPAAARTSVMALSADDREPVLGLGVLPVWFGGTYGGPLFSPLWAHARMEDQFCGATRYFLTDPVPFQRELTFAYTPGPEAPGHPTGATLLALWYRPADSPYAAPPLPERAEALPYSRYRTTAAARDSRPAWVMEAEDLVPFATAYGGEARAIEDTEHNYHPSAGSYLHVGSDQVGDYVDCLVPLPVSRYVAVGTNSLWGPNRSGYEQDLLSKTEAQVPPGFTYDLDVIRGRATGGVQMTAPIQVGDWLIHFRDSSTEYPIPLLNPAPGQEGILRFICRVKAYAANTLQMKLDQVRMEMPPATAAGWQEFEEGVMPQTSGELRAGLPKYGDFAWSGWGALRLTSPADGQAEFRTLVVAGLAKPEQVRIKGNLGPRQGGWAVRVNGGPWIVLTPGRDEKEAVEWVLPVEGLTLPAPVAIELRCTNRGKASTEREPDPPAELALDCWSVG